MKENIIQVKTFNFALKIVNTYKYLTETKHDFILSKQMLRSGTSVGANVEESSGSQSKNDFISKLAIAYKEARETSYWIKLLNSSKYLTVEQSSILLSDIDEILRIIGKIQITIKNKSC